MRICSISIILATFFLTSAVVIGAESNNMVTETDGLSLLAGTTPNLVANWSFSEGSGSYANDSSGRNNNGTLTNFDLSTCWVNGVVGTGLKFDGSNDYVNVADSPDFGPMENITVSVWVYPTKNMPTGSIVSKRNAFIIHPGNGDNKITFYIYDGGWKSVGFATPIELNKWTYITGVYGNYDNEFKLYFNGVEVATNPADYGAIVDDGGVLTIGRDDGTSRYFPGMMDEVRIYNTTLNATQIGDYYNNTLDNNVFINTTSLPRGRINAYYETQLEGWAGTGSYTWTLASGTLPNGITLGTDGKLSGTPTQFGYFPIGVTVTDTNTNTRTATLNIPIQKEWNLQLELLMDDGAGASASDGSGTGRDGSLTNMDLQTCWVDGLTGDALSFDGVNDYVVVPDGDGFDNQDNITVSAWVFPTGKSGYHSIVSKRNAFILSISEVDNSARFYIYDGGWKNTEWSDPLDMNQWTHVAGTYCNTDNIFKLYVNGVEEESNPADYGAISNDGGSLYIGRDDGYSDYFTGSIDEVMIYNRTLNGTEVGDYYNDTWKDHLKDHVFMERTTFPYGVVSQAYDHSMTVVGGTGIYTWTVDTGEIPKGLTLTQTGHISGTPTEKGAYVFEIKVTDTNGSSTSRPFSIIIVGNDAKVVGDWDFNSKELGLGLDLSGYWNNGTLTNIDTNTNVVTGKLRPGIRFDGVNDYVRVPHSASLDLNQDITVEAWAKAGFVDITIEPQPPTAIPISNVTELQKIGSGASYPLDGDYYLTNDISAGATYTWNSNKGFDPIGTSSAKFTGTLDGRGYIIYRLYIDRPTEDYMGLFAYTSGATITNLGMEGWDVTGDYYRIGALAGRADYTTIVNTYVTGSVQNNANSWSAMYVGGLIGYADHCMIYTSYTDVSVSASTDEEVYCIGGFIGMGEYGHLENCYSKGTVTATIETPFMMQDYVGGLVGRTYRMNILNCYATGDVTATDVYTVGGLVGRQYEGSITNSYATGYVRGRSSVGGLAGSLSSTTIRYCYATGNVRGLIGFGGLVGNSGSSNIYYSYATGNIYEASGTNSYSGGLAGYLSSSTVSNCYSYNNYVYGDDHCGGLVGRRSDSNVINSYSRAKDVSASTNVGGLIGSATGSGSVTSSYFYNGYTSSSPGGGTPKTSAQLQQESTYVGWDFEFRWSMGGPSNWAKLQRPWYRLVQKGTGAYSIHLNSATSTVKAGIGPEYLNASVTDVDDLHGQGRHRAGIPERLGYRCGRMAHVRDDIQRDEPDGLR
jgi:hypothetical protein